MKKLAQNPEAFGIHTIHERVLETGMSCIRVAVNQIVSAQAAAELTHTGSLEKFESCDRGLGRSVEASCISLNLVVRGRFRVRHRQLEEWVEPGCVFLTDRYMNYDISHRESQSHDTCISVSIESDRGADLTVAALLANGQTVLKSQRSRVLFIGQAIVSATQRSCFGEVDDLTLALPSALLYEAKLPLTRHSNEAQYRWYAERIDSVRRLVYRDPAADLSLTALARSVGMSPFHFARVFAELSGTTPHAFVRTVRLSAARDLLQRGASVTHACAASGFSSLAHFSRTFKRAFRTSPSRIERPRADRISKSRL